MAKKKKNEEPEDDPIPPETVARMMVKCGRRCCICRRFRPIRLQVHHIVERSDGGTHDEDNLIVTCQTCHTDIHSYVPFMRRFTAEEQKGHRDTLIKLVGEGTLPASDSDDTDAVFTLIAQILGQQQPKQPTELMPEAQAILATACREGENQGRILITFDNAGWTLACGDKSRRIPHTDRRGQARCDKAIEQLVECKLIQDAGVQRGSGGNIKGCGPSDTTGTWWLTSYLLKQRNKRQAKKGQANEQAHPNP